MTCSLDDQRRVGFLPSSKSGKYKRLRNSPRITLQPSDARGKVKALPTRAGVRRAGVDYIGCYELRSVS
jgi:hypothetical protein